MRERCRKRTLTQSVGFRCQVDEWDGLHQHLGFDGFQIEKHATVVTAEAGFFDPPVFVKTHAFGVRLVGIGDQKGVFGPAFVVSN